MRSSPLGTGPWSCVTWRTRTWLTWKWKFWGMDKCCSSERCSINSVFFFFFFCKTTPLNGGDLSSVLRWCRRLETCQDVHPRKPCWQCLAIWHCHMHNSLCRLSLLCPLQVCLNNLSKFPTNLFNKNLMFPFLTQCFSTICPLFLEKSKWKTKSVKMFVLLFCVWCRMIHFQHEKWQQK